MPQQVQGPTPPGTAPNASDDGGFPFSIAGLARSSDPAAVDQGDVVSLIADLLGYLGIRAKGQSNVAIRASSTITGSETGTALTGLDWARHAAIQVLFTDVNLPNAANKVHVDLKTSYDAGTTWVTIERKTLTNADDNDNNDLNFIFVAALAMSSAVAREVDAAIADDTKRDLPISDRLRVDVTFDNTTGSPSLTFSIAGNFK